MVNRGKTLKKFVRILCGAMLLLLGSSAMVSADVTDESVNTLIKREISKRYQNARIELAGDIRWTRGVQPAEVKSIAIMSENQAGDLQFLVKGVGSDGEMVAEGWINFSAWVPAWITVRRILPGEKLSRDMVTLQEVNVASGMVREYRGVLLSRDSDFNLLESRQTIMEGQFVLTTAVRQVPDIRRGEAVKIRMIAGEISVTTHGIAEEAAYIDHEVRVMASKTKHTLVGKLRAGSVVEVSL